MKYTIVNSITSKTVCGGPARRRSSEAISFSSQYVSHEGVKLLSPNTEDGGTEARRLFDRITGFAGSFVLAAKDAKPAKSL